MNQKTEILTLDNGYKIWTHTQGKGSINVLAVHGGPGMNHEYWESAYNYLNKNLDDFTLTMYDQLGSWYSETPDFSKEENRKKFLRYDYFVDEIEEVRQKLGIDDFYLLGHSWGGLLAQAYSVKYGSHLKGVIIASMVDDIDDYTKSLNQLRDSFLSKDEVAFMKNSEENKDFTNDKYVSLVNKLMGEYMIRTDSTSIDHLVDVNNNDIYNAFQGDNEFVITGLLKQWHFTDQLKNITVPTFIIFGGHETMPISSGKRMEKLIPHSKFSTTPNAGHFQMLDNPDSFYSQISQFIKDVESNTF